jgi:predicted enzyme related to lactoylglutathione lyase
VYVEVDDVLENLAYAEELGGTIVRPPYELTRDEQRTTLALFRDPAGNIVGLSKGLDDHRAPTCE